ncbi:MAG: sugar nucleotide-binding protein [Bacteriovoracaceae bacterium]|nr:sugar nucleotide-binding protein [Bacteriovoracaceae bacterium]
MKKKTILIFGISSFVGSNLAEFLSADYKVVGTYHKTKTKIPRVLTLPCDVLAKEEVQLVIFTVKPDVTIYAVGLTSISECDEAPAIADALNTLGLFNVSEYCQRYKSQVCYISSSYVFSGENRDYLELDTPNADTVYGRTKSFAEFFLQKSSLNYMIFRCCNLYGRSYRANHYTWFEQLQRTFLNRGNMVCDNFVHDGFLDVYYFAMIVKLAIDIELSNRLLQISSADYLTHFDFASKYCKIFGETQDLIHKGRWQFPQLDINTPDNDGTGLYFKLNISNVESLMDMTMPTLEESLQFTFTRMFGIKSKSKVKANSSDIKFI